MEVSKSGTQEEGAGSGGVVYGGIRNLHLFFHYGESGDDVVIYYLSQTDGKEEYLGTIQTLFCVTLICNNVLRVYNGILGMTHVPYIVIGGFCILGGVVLVNKIVDRLDEEKLKKITYVVIGVSGLLNFVP